MDTRALRYAPLLVVVALCSALPAHAWISALWTAESIAREVYVIAVGEVTATSAVGDVPPDQTGGPSAPLRMTAQVRVLRCYSDHPDATLAAGDSITIAYRSPQGGHGMEPPYVSLKVGDCFAFPLRGPRPGPTQPWTLIDDISDYPLVPCAKDTPSAGATGRDFLLNELAGALASSDRALALAAARKASHPLLSEHKDPSLVDDFGKALEPYVGQDEAHWLRIAVALYTSMGTPRPTLAQCRAGDVGEGRRAAPVVVALSHVTGEDLDRRLLDALLGWLDLNSWGVGAALKDNYWHDPDAVQRLTKAVDEGDLATFLMLADLVHAADDPVAPSMLGAALARLRDRTPLPDAADGPVSPQEQALRRASRLVRYFGDEEALGVLLAEAREAQQADPHRFDALWQGADLWGPPHVVEFCRIGIDDRRAMPGKQAGWRYCDMAAAHLQRETGEDFGWSRDADLPQREAAVARAKAWLAVH